MTGVGGEDAPGPAAPTSGPRWTALGWGAAALLTAAATLLPVGVQHSAAFGGSGYVPGEAVTSMAVTTFDVWGGTDTRLEPPTSLAGVEVPGGPMYGVLLVAALVVLLAAALTAAAPRRLPLPRVLTSLAPVAAGLLAGVAACQLLAYQSTTRALAFGTDDPALAALRPQWQLGPSPWLVVAAAAVALATWLLARREPAATPQPTAVEAAPLSPTALDPAVFRRPPPGPQPPIGDHLESRD